MNAAFLAAIVFVAFALGYRFYSAFLSRRLFAIQPDEPMPSKEFVELIEPLFGKIRPSRPGGHQV